MSRLTTLTATLVLPVESSSHHSPSLRSTSISLRGEAADSEAAALDYERQLHIIDSPTQKGSPHLDLLLLGLGQDGHTAFLIPGTKAVSERQRLVAVGQPPTGITTRLTLTLGVINRTSVVLSDYRRRQGTDRQDCPGTW